MDLKTAAEAYEPKKTLNIADLESVSVDVPIEPRTFKEGTPDEFSLMVAIVDGQEYRVPESVLKQLKALLADKRTSKMRKFSVIKSGTTKTDTKYSVVPMGL